MKVMGQDYLTHLGHVARAHRVEHFVAKAQAAGESLHKLFAHFDVNGDGYITSAECVTISFIVAEGRPPLLPQDAGRQITTTVTS